MQNPLHTPIVIEVDPTRTGIVRPLSRGRGNDAPMIKHDIVSKGNARPTVVLPSPSVNKR